MDKIICLYYLILAIIRDITGQADESEEDLRTAVRMARAFDRDPVYTMENFLFIGEANVPGTFYDTSGPTAADGLRDTLREHEDLVSGNFRLKFEQAMMQ